MTGSPDKLPLVATGGIDGWVSVSDVTGVVLNSAAFIYDHDSGPQAVTIYDIDVPGNRLLLWYNGQAINASGYTTSNGSALSFPGGTFYNPSVPINTGALQAPYVLAGNGDTVPFTINAALNQTTKLQSWGVNGTELAYVSSNGVFTGQTQTPVVDLGTVSGNVTVDLSTASQIAMTIGGYTSLSFTGSTSAGISKSTVLRITNGGYTGFTTVPVGVVGSYRLVNWTGTKFVALVASTGTAVAESTDGIMWAMNPGPLLYPVNTLTMANGLYWAANNRIGGGPSLMSSTDGYTWTPRLTTGDSARGVAWNGQVYVSSVGPLIRYSADGTTWFAASGYYNIGYTPIAFAWSPTQNKWIGVISNNNANVLSGSADGTTWGLVTHGQAQNMNAVCWGNNLFVIVGAAGKIATSPDGTNWTPAVSGTASALQGVVWNGSVFLAVGANVILTSINGVDWIVRTQPINTTYYTAAWDGTAWLVAGDSAMVRSTDLITWTLGGPPATSGRYLIVNGKRITVGDSTARIAISDDGVLWKRAVLANATYTVSNITYGSGVYVASSVSSSTIYYSDDLLTWTSVNHFAWSNTLTLFDGTRFVGISANTGQATTNNAPMISTSLNGSAWSSVGPAPYTFDGFSPISLTWDGTAYYVTTAACRIYRSTNLVTWAIVLSGASDGIGGDLYNIIVNGPLLVAYGAAGALYTSTDGIVWTLRNARLNTYAYGAWNGTTFCLLGASLQATSTDGITWNVRASNVAPISAPGGGAPMHFLNGGWFLPTTSSNVARSSSPKDGVDWPTNMSTAGGALLVLTTKTDYVEISHDPIANKYIGRTIVTNIA